MKTCIQAESFSNLQSWMFEVSFEVQDVLQASPRTGLVVVWASNVPAMTFPLLDLSQKMCNSHGCVRSA